MARNERTRVTHIRTTERTSAAAALLGELLPAPGRETCGIELLILSIALPGQSLSLTWVI